MRNILLTISYDGTDFCGWQRQDCAADGTPVRTVQGEVERALMKIHKEQVRLTGSGRTDSGVHAVAQAAHFFSPIDTIPAERYVPALNSLLSRDVRIMEAKEVPGSFSARFSATSRTYRYFIHTGIPCAGEARYVWTVRHKPDIGVLNEMASCLRGEIDCAAFAAAGDKSLSTFRYIEGAKFFVDGRNSQVVVFEITANAFLWKMVRSLVGSLVFFEKRSRSPEYFRAVLESKDRRRAGPTAPPEGLFLWSVDFSGERRHV